MEVCLQPLLDCNRLVPLQGPETPKVHVKVQAEIM